MFVKTAIENLLDEGAIGLCLTGLMIMIFLGNIRATVAVFLSIPLSALATFLCLSFGDNSINSMVLGGLALAFSRLIDNSVVVLENIFRHLEMGEPPEIAAEKGGSEVGLPVLAATFATVVVFFPVTFLYGVSRFLFSALALSVVFSLFASYVVAMTVVPLFCAKLIKGHGHDPKDDRYDASGKDDLPVYHDSSGFEAAPGPALPRGRPPGWGTRFNLAFNAHFNRFLDWFGGIQSIALDRPWWTVLSILGLFALSFLLMPFVGLAYFPRTDPGQFVVTVKAPTGMRVEMTEQEVAKVEALIRRVVPKEDLGLVVSNIGVTPDFSAMYTSNSASHTAFVQASLVRGHKTGSYEYMDRVRVAIRREMPELTTYFQSGGLVDAVLNMGLPAPIDVQVSATNLADGASVAAKIARRAAALGDVSDVLVPQDIDAPALRVNVDRLRVGQLGLSEQDVVDNIITALTSNAMIAPSYWIDPNTGNDYFLTVQYPEDTIKTLNDLKSIPLRSATGRQTVLLEAVAKVQRTETPTEVDHYQLRRVIDVFVAPKSEALGGVANEIDRIIAGIHQPEGTIVTMRGTVQAMRSSFRSFGLGLIMAVVLVYLILVAQFRSFVDPFLILLAVPPGITGVLIILALSGTTLNIMSLMGVVMLVGIATSNSILIVEFTHRLIEDGMAVRQAAGHAVRVRLRPVLMTSLATLIGLIPMALKLGEGSESYAPLARSIIGGLAVSVVLTVFIVPAAFLLVYGGRDPRKIAPAYSPVPHLTAGTVA
jgi:multidrug efflux pump subunit AcrB